jgi:hypothetical protein
VNSTSILTVETSVGWIPQPFLTLFLPCVTMADRENSHTKVIERTVQATRQPDGRGFELFRRVHVFFRKRQPPAFKVHP